MKKLFEFTINKKIEREVESVGKDSEGNEVKGLKVITEEVPIKLAIKKPTRELSDAALLFYSAKISEALKANVLSEALFRKRLQNDGGAFSDQENSEINKLYTNYYKKQADLMPLDTKKFDELTEEEKAQKESLKIDLGELVRNIQLFEYANSKLFENTAEAFARKHQIRWWILNLSYIQKFDDKGNPKDDFEPLFNAIDYEKKLVIYDSKEEAAEEFYVAAIRKLAYLINYWSNDVTLKEEDFKKLSDSYDNELKSESA